MRICAMTVSLLVLIGMSTSSYGAPPAAINIHGQLLAPAGAPLSGIRDFQLTFYDAETDGNVLGSTLTGATTLSADGLFNITVAPPVDILLAPEVWYELGIDSDEPADNDASDDLFPDRVRLFSVPFALQAQEVVGVDADRVGSGNVDNTEFEALDGVTSDIQGQIDAIDTSGIAANANDIADNIAAIATKANSADVYTQAEIDTQQGLQDTEIAAKANTADVYTQAEIDTQQGLQDTEIAAKANSADVYTQAEIDTQQGLQDTAIAAKANTADVYTQAEIDTQQGLQDTEIAAKANSADVYTQAEIDTQQGLQDTAIAAKANSADVYTQAESDTNFVTATGDAMSGPLAVDTINEATSDAGVLVDGLLIKDGEVNINMGGAMGPFQVGGATGAVTVDQEQATGPNAFSANSTSHYQSFTAGLTGDLTRITVATGLGVNGTLNVYEGDGTGGTQLNAGEAVSTGSIDLTLASPIPVTAGEVYSFEIVYGGSFGINIRNDNPYAGGGYQGSGSQDLTFATYVEPVTNALTVDSNGLLGVNTDSPEETLDIDGAIRVRQANAPASTTDRVYNDGGNLFFSGTQITNGGGLNETDTLADVTGRGATTTANINLSGAAQTLTFSNPTGSVGINSLSVLGMTLEGLTVLNGTVSNVGQIIANDDSVANPALTYGSDTDTGIHRPGANQLAMVTGGAVRLSVDNSEVNLSNNTMEIASGAAPGTTTNKLYNTAGNLFWNGTQLNGGGGGGAEEIIKGANIASFSESPAYPFPGNFDWSQDIRHNQSDGTRSAPFPIFSTAKVIQEIRVFLREDEAFTGTQEIGVQYTIRKINTGAVEHNVTAVINLTTLTQDTWINLPIAAGVSDRTIENDEFLTYYTTTISGTDNGEGDYNYVEEVVVQ